MNKHKKNNSTRLNPVQPLDHLGPQPVAESQQATEEASRRKARRARRVIGGIAASATILVSGAIGANATKENQSPEKKPTPTTLVVAGPGDTLRSLSDEHSQDLREDPIVVSKQAEELNPNGDVELGDVVSLPSTEEHNDKH